MEGESNKLIWIGVALLLVVIIASAIFTVLNMGQRSKDESLDKITNVIGNMDLAQFNQYDQKVVSGSIAASSLENFKSQSVTIFVRTNNGYLVRYLAGAAKTVGTVSILPTTPFTQTGHAGTDTVGTADWAIKDGRMPSQGYFSGFLSTDWDAPTVYNQDFSKISRPAEPQYIKPTGRFAAVLIRDSNDQIIGISFSQRPER